MLKSFSKIAMLLVFLQMGAQLNAQVCWLAKDSVFQGSDSSAFAVYGYDAGRLVTIEYTDSNSTTVETTDSIIYGANGMQRFIRAYDQGLSFLFRTSTITYDSNNRISRVHILEDDGFGTSTIAHNVLYNASNEITSIIIDSTALTGTPDAFDLSFINMVWQNGNLISIDLVGDIIGTGVDTIEFTVECDTMPNVRRLLPIEEVGSLIEQISANNIKKLITVNDESFGLAGTLALDRVYTYHSHGEVSSVFEKVALFNEEETTTGYNFKCSGIGLEEKSFTNLSIYPLPATDEIRLQTNETMNIVRLYTMSGQLIMEKEINSKDETLSITLLSKGFYMVEITGDDKVSRSKILVD